MISRCEKSCQKGYVTVLTLILFSVLGLSLFAVFNSGQIVTHKLKLQNAVDAATYSSVNVVAREMNYMAYTNRAMVSNQIAIGQMVGLYSWHRKTKDTVDSLDTAATILALFPPTSPVGVPLQKATSLIANVFSKFDPFLKNAIKLGITFENPVIEALSKSQRNVHLATSAILIETYKTVLEDNNDAKGDSSNKIDFSVLMPVAFFDSIEGDGKFIKRVSSPNTGNSGGAGNMADYDAFANIIANTDDGFVHDRSNSWVDANIPFPLMTILANAAGGPTKLAKNGNINIRDFGGSDFDRKLSGNTYVWEWSAMDTVSLWVKYKYWKISTFWKGWRTYDKEVVSIGGGAAHATNDNVYDTYYDSNPWNPSVKRVKWGDAGYNKKSAKFAASNDSNKKLGSSSKLHSFYKFEKNGQEIIGPEFVAMVSKKQNGVRTRNRMIEDHTGNAVPVNGSFNIEKEGNMSDGRMYAIAKAQVYFARTPDDLGRLGGMLSHFSRDDGKQEAGNLFNPYWQVRLVDYDIKDINATKAVLVKGL